MNGNQSSSNVIVRKSVEPNCIKLDSINYCNFSGARRVVSQTFAKPKAIPKPRKIIKNVNDFPRIAIKREDGYSAGNPEVVLVNGCWDTTNRIPSLIAEMQNVSGSELQGLQNICVYKQEGLTDSQEYSASPLGSDSGIESDCTDGNLSWLLNYKIHELPPVPDSTAQEQIHPAPPPELPSTVHFSSVLEPPRMLEAKTVKTDIKTSAHPYYRYSGLKKPPFTYTELIEHALNEKGELTVSGIYQWISDHFPFYKQNDDRWKNSVRHNLSINPHFRKGGKAVHGAGHLWTIAQKDDKKAWQIKKQRMQQFIQTAYKDRSSEAESFDRELQAATESILGESFREFDGQNAENHNAVPKQELEIEYVNIIDVQNGLEDFLSPPVSKQEIVQECGLGSDFFITDLNPNALGLNLAEAEAASEESIYDDMPFQYYELHKN